MYRLILLFAVSLFFCLHGISQNPKTIKGRVLDARDSTPIAYCNIYLKDKAIGTHSNEDGFFVFTSIHIDSDTVVISSISYESLKIRMEHLSTNDTVFLLNPSSLMLNEVIVSGEIDSASIIVSNAIRNISKNYPKERYYLDAFYRELVLRDTTYVRLIEAAIGIQDPGFDTPPDKIKVRVNEIRKSDDFLKYDGYSFVHEKLYGDENNLFEVLKSDVIRGSTSKEFRFLGDYFIENFSFNIIEFSESENRRIYEIAYTSNYKGDLQEYGTLNIESNNWAILSIEYNNGIVNIDNKIEPLGFFFEGTLYKKYIINYRGVNGKYFLDYINWFTPVKKAWSTANENGGKSLQYFKCSLFVNNVITNRKEIDSIKKKESEKRDIDLYAKDWKYNPEFWKHYNYVRMNSIYKKALGDIGERTPIDQQFKKH